MIYNKWNPFHHARLLDYQESLLFFIVIFKRKIFEGLGGQTIPGEPEKFLSIELINEFCRRIKI